MSTNKNDRKEVINDEEINSLMSGNFKKESAFV